MGMTTETTPRLDAATLRWAVAEVSTMRDAYANVGGGDPCNALAGIAHDLRRALAVTESAPPRLSDWVAACEGTALGEPGICRESLDFSLGLFFDVDGFGRTEGADPEEWAAIEVHLDAERPGGWMARVYVARDEGAMHARCTTPSDLRAALEALAKESK
jgi:hypothetical protein